MTFELFSDFVRRKVEENYNRDGFIVPVFLAVSNDEKLDTIPLSDLDHLGKEGMSKVLRMYCEGEAPMFTAHIAEANLLITNVNDIGKILNSELLKPAVHPDRIDVVSISLCSKYGSRKHVVYRTVNNGLEKPRLEIMSNVDGGGEGLFANLI
jgi:hypothetical protein